MRKNGGIILFIVALLCTILLCTVLVACTPTQDETTPPTESKPIEPELPTPIPPEIDEPQFYITYNDMDKVTTTKYLCGTNVVLYRPLPRTGYTFRYWQNADGSPAPNTINTSSADITIFLTAYWETTSYKVTLKSNSDTSDYIFDYTIESDSIILQHPTRTGYAFAGWYEKNVATAVTVIEKGSACDFTLYAKWNALTYSIDYHNVFDQFVGGDEYNITSADFVLPTPIKERCVFLGWWDNPQYSGASIATISKGSSGNLDLYAKWSQPIYTVKYNLNGGNASGIKDKYSAELGGVNLDTIVPTKQGYFFLGWHTHPDCTKSSKIVTIAQNETKDYTLFASWRTGDSTANIEYGYVCTADNHDSLDSNDHRTCYMTVQRISNYTSTQYKVAKTYSSLSVTQIDARAFSSLQHAVVILPDSVISIGEQAFMSTTNLTIELPKSLQSIQKGAFQGANDCAFTIPRSVGDRLGQELFMYSSQCDIEIENGVSIVPTKAFYGSDIASINLPSSVTGIGDMAFSNMGYVHNSYYNGVTITLGGSIQQWGKALFVGSYIRRLNISPNQRSIDADVLFDLRYIDNINIVTEFYTPISVGQSLANDIAQYLYRQYMGFNNPNFRISFECATVNANSGLLGHYSDSTPEQICVSKVKNASSPFNTTNFELDLRSLTTMAHETRHYYQSLNVKGKIGSIYSNQIPVELRPTTKQIDDWRLPYISGEVPELYPDYYHQPREEDARAKATFLTGYTPPHTPCRLCPTNRLLHVDCLAGAHANC